MHARDGRDLGEVVKKVLSGGRRLKLPAHEKQGFCYLWDRKEKREGRSGENITGSYDNVLYLI